MNKEQEEGYLSLIDDAACMVWTKNKKTLLSDNSYTWTTVG